jgi:hypothetical protein
MAFDLPLTRTESFRLAIAKVLCPLTKLAIAEVPVDDFIYGIYISQKHRYVYIDNPKTGCTSLKSALAELELRGEENHLNPYDPNVIHFSDSPLKRFAPIFPNPSLTGLKRQGYRFFSFVRNPYTRLLSCYLDKFCKERVTDTPQSRRMPGGKAPADFRSFIKAITEQEDWKMDPHWRPQTTNLHFPHFPYTFIGRFESYMTDFLALFERLGIDSANIPTLRHLNKTNKSSTNLRDFYDKSIQDLVYERYQSDFVHFAYPYELPQG